MNDFAYADFWILAGTIAPVLLVGQAVTAGRFFEEYVRTGRTLYDGTVTLREAFRLLLTIWKRSIIWTAGMSAASAGANVVVIFWALTSLSDGRNRVDPGHGIGFIIGSIVLQVIVFVIVSFQRLDAERAAARRSNRRPRPGPK